MLVAVVGVVPVVEVGVVLVVVVVVVPVVDVAAVVSSSHLAETESGQNARQPCADAGEDRAKLGYKRHECGDGFKQGLMLELGWA